MTEEKFFKLKKEIKDYVYVRKNAWSPYDYWCNYRKYFDRGVEEIVREFNFKGGIVFTDSEGIDLINTLIYFDVFSDEEWKEILPCIFFDTFNRDFDVLMETVGPLFGKIYKYKKDFHLEFWQGIFSDHWRIHPRENPMVQYQLQTGKLTNEEVEKMFPEVLPLEERINSKENGKLYCDTLLEIYPHIEEFINEHGFARYTLMDRLG